MFPGRGGCSRGVRSPAGPAGGVWGQARGVQGTPSIEMCIRALQMISIALSGYIQGIQGKTCYPEPVRTSAQSQARTPARARVARKPASPQARGRTTNTVQKQTSADPWGRESLKHSAKAGPGGSAGTGIFETLCKNGPRRRLKASRILNKFGGAFYMLPFIKVSLKMGFSSRSAYCSHWPSPLRLFRTLAAWPLAGAGILEPLCKSGPRRPCLARGGRAQRNKPQHV